MSKTVKRKKLIEELREYYAQPVIPPCPVCGAPRTSIAACGMGRVTYCCSAEAAQPMGSGDKFEECMKHFGESRYETVIRGDSRVLELCDIVEELQKKCEKRF